MRPDWVVGSHRYCGGAYCLVGKCSVLYDGGEQRWGMMARSKETCFIGSGQIISLDSENKFLSPVGYCVSGSCCQSFQRNA